MKERKEFVKDLFLSIIFFGIFCLIILIFTTPNIGSLIGWLIGWYVSDHWFTKQKTLTKFINSFRNNGQCR